MTKTHTIYLILVNNSPAYIGTTTSTLTARLARHKYDTKSHKSFWGEYLGEAMAKGLPIKIVPLAFAYSESAALAKEDFLIKRYQADGADLFNRKAGGKYSLDARRRQSKAHKGISTAKQMVLIKETGELFKSISSAARAYGFLVGSICNSIRHGCKHYGFTFVRVGE